MVKPALDKPSEINEVDIHGHRMRRNNKGLGGSNTTLNTVILFFESTIIVDSIFITVSITSITQIIFLCDRINNHFS